MAGFCVALPYAFGPAQEYPVPPEEFSCIVTPAQYGPVLEAVGTGNGFTVTVVVAVAEQLLASVTVTVYVPELTTAAGEMVGFCVALLYAFGPFQEYPVPPEEFNCIVVPAQ